MPELMRKSVGLPWIGGWGGGDRSVALKHKLMLNPMRRRCEAPSTTLISW